MVEAIEEDNHGFILYTDIEKLKEAMDLVLDTLGLPPCGDIQRARESIRRAIRKDRIKKEHIDYVIKLVSNIVYDTEDNNEERSNASIERRMEQIDDIKSFVTLNPVNKRL